MGDRKTDYSQVGNKVGKIFFYGLIYFSNQDVAEKATQLINREAMELANTKKVFHKPVLYANSLLKSCFNNLEREWKALQSINHGLLTFFFMGCIDRGVSL